MTTTQPTYRYVQIADDLRDQIQDGTLAATAKLPAEQEIAESFGVSRLTLRKAVDMLVDEGLVVRHRGKGTFVGGAPDEAAAQATVVFVGDISAHVWNDVYAAVASTLQDAGGRMATYSPTANTQPDPGFAAWLASVGERPDIVCQREYWPAIASGAAARDCRVVCIDMPTQRQSLPVPLVEADMLRAGELATQYLLDAGHRQIGFFGFGSDPAPGPGFYLPFPGNLAYSGYLHAMRTAGLPTVDLAVGGYGGGTELQDQIRAFIAHRGGWPEGIVCQQDYKARDILAAAQSQGIRVPQDVSIVSIGDTPWAQAMMPALTSVNYRPDCLAALALQLVRTHLAAPPQVARVEPLIVPRESVLPRPAAEVSP